jgi:hypothetical protein
LKETTQARTSNNDNDTNRKKRVVEDVEDVHDDEDPAAGQTAVVVVTAAASAAAAAARVGADRASVDGLPVKVEVVEGGLRAVRALCRSHHRLEAVSLAQSRACEGGERGEQCVRGPCCPRR